ncbi:hypothetical protein M407DRAFT_17741 [Tulasnella calospora MUT 4182]|uniref:SH3 domain-containing protein n=1 Tax=Tulasnella calospora MUT 4182 TaxID=1051891 RepID=A0A0C3QVA2_9AGAM|nr:hypothetical protein M407DRAFT_17741 [Tulasnella calospora MUT 4182]
MASGVGELEALLATPHIAFLRSSSTINPPENTRQGIAAFRESMPPPSTLASTPSHTKAYVQRQDARSNLFENHGEWTNAALTVCSCHDKFDALQLSKQIDILQTEVREGTSQIRELIQSVASLGRELKSLRSALVASKSVTSSEVQPTSQEPSANAIKGYTALTLIDEAKVDPTSEEHSGVASSASPSTAARLSPKRRASKAKKTPALPRAQSTSQPISSGSSPMPTSTLAGASTTQTVSSTAENSMPTSSNVKSEKCACQSLSQLAKEKGAARTQKCNTCSVSDRPNAEADEVADSGNSGDKELHPKAPIIATAVKYFSAYNEGEMDLRPKDRITILDSPDTPVDWMYGEIIETRRGIFPAQHIRELPRQDKKGTLDDNSDFEDSEATELRPEAPVIATAVNVIETR